MGEKNDELMTLLETTQVLVHILLLNNSFDLVDVLSVVGCTFHFVVPLFQDQAFLATFLIELTFLIIKIRQFSLIHLHFFCPLPRLSGADYDHTLGL